MLVLLRMSRVVQVNFFTCSLNEIGKDGVIFNDNILVQAKQEYLDSLFDLLSYQKKIMFCLFSMH
jgi:hypothetical protein